MPSIVTGILRFTLIELLGNKARDATAKKLKDGDITDAKLRGIVVRELDDVKTKIDAIARKDLLSSYTFLQGGVTLLIASLDKLKDEQKAVQSETQDNRGETSRMPSGDESADVLNKALKLSDHAIGKLKIVSYESESAKELFKDAYISGQHMRFATKHWIFKTESSQRNSVSFRGYWNISTILT